MSKCSRCGHEIGKGEVHIFSGGEERRALVAGQLNTIVSLCGVPISLENDITCCRCGEVTAGIFIRANPAFCRYNGYITKGHDPLGSQWSHPVCDECWFFWNPDREPVRLIGSRDD